MELRDKYLGPFNVTESVEMRGMVIGDATVSDGATLTLRGMITGNLTVLKGGAALVHGTVEGAVVNLGGEVEVYGVVGDIDEVTEGRTIIFPNAIVQSRQV